MRRFLLMWLAGLAGLSGLVLALTVTADPYGLLGTPRIKGLTADKVAAADRPRLTKPYMVERQEWATIVLGASNADVGFDPDSPAWPEDARPAFNLAIDGSNPDVQARFLQHALATRHPKSILVGVALEEAMLFPARKVSAAVAAQWSFESRLRVGPAGTPNPDYPLARLQDLAFATFSLQALSDSVLTVLRQNDPERTSQTEHGQNNAGNFARWVRAEGSYSLVMDKDNDRTPQLLSWAADPRTETAGIASMIRMGRAQGAQVIVFIMPSYVDQMEALRQTGLTPLYEEWKRTVARTVEAAAAGGPAVPLWDFSGYSPYTTEKLPGPRDTSHPLHWFWEPVHFRTALGDLMVRRMLGDGPADFGAEVTSATLPAQFAEYDDKQQQWVATHPDDVERIAGVVHAAAVAVCGNLALCPKPGIRATASR